MKRLYQFTLGMGLLVSIPLAVIIIAIPFLLIGEATSTTTGHGFDGGIDGLGYAFALFLGTPAFLFFLYFLPLLNRQKEWNTDNYPEYRLQIIRNHYLFFDPLFFLLWVAGCIAEWYSTNDPSSEIGVMVLGTALFSIFIIHFFVAYRAFNKMK